MRLKSNFFLKFYKGSLVLWDFENHRQFELDDFYTSEIIKFARSPETYSNTQLIEELKNLDLLESNDVSPNTNWEWDDLSFIFHKGTSNLNSQASPQDEKTFIQEYLNHSSEILESYNFTPLYSDNPINLPTVDSNLLSNLSLIESLANRKTCRNFAQETLSLNDISKILYITFGNFHKTDCELESHNFIQYSARKTSPSGGNIHPEEAFLYLFDVESLVPGFYYYNNESHSLHLINNEQISYEVLTSTLNNQFFATNSSAILFFVTRFEKIWWKYKHSRSYRFAHFEMGGYNQTFQLLTTALNLNFWQTGAFQDSKVEKFLKLKDTEACIFIAAIGKGDGNAIPQKFLTHRS